MAEAERHNLSVAILAPSFDETGGAERLNAGLHAAIRNKVGKADLLTLPSDESSFEAIIETYRQWQELDLSAYDMVISTKAPTYAVQHPRHVVYLVHTIRVFYDMFEQTFPVADAVLHEQRLQIHRMDSEALAAARKVFTIGYEVARRVHRWNGVGASVLHPPLGFDEFRMAAAEDFFFMPGRLHPWKRVDLAIRAIQSTNLQTKLKIAGMGEAEEDLKALAGSDPRIVFLGRVTDEQLVDLYSRSLGVLFVPVREDYGYVTLEAFKSGKPVITCVDSGETLEFVKHGKSGLVCTPDVESVARAMETLCSDRSNAAKMGLKGRESIEHITWDKVAEKLLDAGFSEPDQERNAETFKTKVAVLDMQPIEPAVGGGRQRLLGLYHNLGDDFEARYVGTYDWPGEQYRKLRLSPTLQEIDIPLSAAHHDAAKALSDKANGKTVIDVAFARQAHLSPDFLDEAKKTAEWADVVIFSHPWVFPLIEKYLKPSQLVVYDSHNVEGFLRAQLFDRENEVDRELVKGVVADEFRVGERAHLVLTCSATDSILFNRIYGWNPSKMEVVPNGVMSSALTPPDESEKRAARQRLGIEHDRPIALFLGSAYPPNVEAALFIAAELAPAIRQVDFVIAGGVCSGLATGPSANVAITGFLEESEKVDWLHAADFAVNPMFSGSGTNIKMFDFMAVGLPIVSTPTGARGITQRDRAGIRIVSKSGFSGAIRSLIESNERRSMSLQNRRWVEDEFAWENISRDLGSLLEKWLPTEGRVGEKLRSRKVPCKANPFRLAHISTCGQKCGVGEYTLRLIEHLPADAIENRIYTCVTPSGEGNASELAGRFDIEPGWYYDNEQWVESRIDEDLVDRILEWQADAVLVQYHKAYYDEGTLARLVAELAAGKVPVAVVFHSFDGLDLSVLSELDSIGAHIISHSKLDIESVSHFNVALEHLPLGMEKPKDRKAKNIRNRDWRNDPPVIATTGFIRAHKGLLKLIDALPIVQSEFPGATLRMVCARYTSTDSENALRDCEARIKQLGLRDSITLETEFLPIDDVYRRLENADIAVLPYDESGEGGSAAATTCLTAGLPVITSKARIFRELNRSVAQLQENTPTCIAETITRLLNDQNAYDDLVYLAREIIAEASWERVSEKLLGIICHEPIIANTRDNKKRS